MGLFITSKAAAIGRGVFALKATPQTQIVATGTGKVGMVGAFPWGPDNVLTNTGDVTTAKLLMAPPGFTRTGYAYLSLLAKAYPQIQIVRVLSSTATAATATLTSSGPTNLVTVTLKYKGVEGNSCTAVVSDASDGDATHFDLTVSITGASGTYSEKLTNRNFSGSASTPLTADEQAKTRLIGSLTKIASGRPANGSYAFTGGTSPALTSQDYVNALAVLEGDPNVRHVFADYPGSSLLDAVNDALIAHKIATGDRIVYLNGIPAQSASQEATDVANYRGAGVAYVAPWAYIRDDVDGTERLVPPASFLASVYSQLPPSTSPSWKAQKVKDMLQGIVRLEGSRGSVKATHTEAGISTLLPADGGGFAFEAAVNTIAPLDSTQSELTTTGMDIYIAKAFVNSVGGSVDAPNVPTNREDIKIALAGFMGGLKNSASIDPNNNVHVVDFTLPPIDSVNTPDDYANGDVTFPLFVQYSNGMHRIFLMLKSGTVTIQAAQ